ncbi:MAG: hypothetical protein JWO06_3435 [Bacteroidota bacterium]|nr:hypothetical protein [Bacteroidota bacterium]
MKRIVHLSVMAVVAALVFTSCHKDRPEVTKVIDVSLTANQSYTYTMAPGGDADDQLQITQQATHFLASTVGIVDAKGDATLNYVPAKDYTGSDEIHVTTVEDHQANGRPQGHGNCDGHHHGGTTYIFKITITGASAVNPG